MPIKTPRPFQEEAIRSGVALFTEAKRLLDATPGDEASRERTVNHNGYLLIEAPTGSGKTLMAGCIVENFTQMENVVWFWFAPFKGVVNQTENALREEHPRLRLRDLSADRAVDSCRAGDAFVTTWQTVATKIKDSRNVRKESELQHSLDTLVEILRGQGLRIGVVVDEAHHGFGKDTQAASFFKEVLRPEYTILVTATPDDADIQHFKKAMRIDELHKITISRADVVDAGLIKEGIKCYAYYPEDEKAKHLIDLKDTALREGIRAHKTLKANLQKLKIHVTPLLLIQADSTKGSIERLKADAMKYGFTEEQIAVHTADEPDANLQTLAHDDRREVLIFKMAVALGFDAPRAFTLVSMRAGHDVNFGVQLIGRILRVHRLLQRKAQDKTIPSELNYGHVFLADLDTQGGLDKAGQLINRIRTEYAKISDRVVLSNRMVRPVTPAGQIEHPFELTSPNTEAKDEPDKTSDDSSSSFTRMEETAFDFGDDENIEHDEDEQVSADKKTKKPAPPKKYRYKIRDDVPRVFKTQHVSDDNEANEEDCANAFMVDVKDVLLALNQKVNVEKRTLDVFLSQYQHELNFAGTLSPERAAHIANGELIKGEIFDSRELRRALLRKLKMVMQEHLIEEANNDKKVVEFLNIIIATNPHKLAEAKKMAIAKNAVIEAAEPLPPSYDTDDLLQSSPMNIYGIYPLGLNEWEKSFAQWLDKNPAGNVLWWHRNEPRKGYSVNVLTSDGHGFYPDFVIGIDGRRTEDHALLVDPKYDFRSDPLKVLAVHEIYGKVLILYKEHDSEWKAVTWNEQRQIPVAERDFRLSDAAGW